MSVKSARYRVVSAQGEISGQAYIDTREMATRAKNTANSVPTYGGYDKNNLSLKTGELMIGQRGSPCLKNAQLGYTSMNAYNYNHLPTDEAIMREHKFIGVVKTDEELEENNYGQLPGSEGAAVLLAGSYTIANTGSDVIGAGDILAWQIPPSARSNQSFDHNGKHRVYQGGPMGTPYSKALIEVVKFVPGDFRSQLWGVAATFNLNKANHGISDVGKIDNSLSTLQEEAMLWAQGISELNAIINPGSNVRIDPDTGILTQVYRTELTDKIFGSEKGRAAIQKLCNAANGAFYAKAERIIGKAMSGGKPGTSLDVMIGLFKVGF